MLAPLSWSCTFICLYGLGLSVFLALSPFCATIWLVGLAAPLRPVVLGGCCGSWCRALVPVRRSFARGVCPLGRLGPRWRASALRAARSAVVPVRVGLGLLRGLPGRRCGPVVRALVVPRASAGPVPGCPACPWRLVGLGPRGWPARCGALVRRPGRGFGPARPSLWEVPVSVLSAASVGSAASAAACAAGRPPGARCLSCPCSLVCARAGVPGAVWALRLRCRLLARALRAARSGRRVSLCGPVSVRSWRRRFRAGCAVLRARRRFGSAGAASGPPRLPGF